MAKIDIDVAQLRANSSSMQGKITELQQLNSSLESLILRIGDSWEGQASEAYVALMQGYAARARNMEGVLEEFKKYIDDAANKFENLDNSSASKIRSSF